MSASSSYFNTTHQRGQTVAEFEAKAKTQDARVLAVFRAHGRPMSPSHAARLGVFLGLLDAKVPLTSVRRAISNLTGVHLVKLDETVEGPYGRPEHLWRLRDEPVPVQLSL